MRRPGNRSGFTKIELIVSVLIVALLFIIALAMFIGSHPRHRGHQQLKDSSQVRGVLQGMVLWSQSNKDRFPLPSLLDPNNTTVPETGAAKDTTANILSVLVYNSFFPPELLISPDEKNPNIVRMDDYDFVQPGAAVDPLKALWDPTLRADFTGPKPGNISYAHLRPGEPEFFRGSPRYGATSIATQAVLGNRGPLITGFSTSGAPIYAPLPTGQARYSVLTHGKPDQWTGNIGYARNHVNFETRETPTWATYTTPDGKSHPDCAFFEEPDAGGLDNFLGIFINAGADKKDFVSIWD